MIRILFLTLIAGLSLARGSDPIAAPALGASASVSQPHVTAELIPETTAVQAGQPFDVALHLHADAGWHTYWINPGDAGLATSIKWTLPPGFTAGPIQWPTPEKHSMGPLVTYGYGGDVYLLTTITPPKADLPQHFDIKAVASWLVCQEECIPGKAELTVSLDSGLMNLRLPQENTELFAEAKARMPVPATGWKVEATYDPTQIAFLFRRKPGDYGAVPTNARFFPEQGNVLSTLDADNSAAWATAKPMSDGRSDYFNIHIKLQQNGDKPKKLSGVLVADQPLIGDAKAIYFAEFRVFASNLEAIGGTTDAPKPQGDPVVTGPVAGNAPAGSSEAAPTSAFPSATWERGTNTEGASGAPPLGTSAATSDSAALTGSGGASAGGDTTLIAVLGAAFIGGLILNLMPCVLPVLSLKVFSLMKHAGDNAKTAWIQGVAFTAGVVLSFWVLAGLLIALRTAGNHLGWGFQMQDPRFVLGLILLFFLLALNLFGVFELGSSLVGLDAKATGHLGGVASSFGNGALATVAATPCTAPFMGSALGFAAQQPAYISMLIFTVLALGMASPYLLLTIFPGALRFVPKPGAWMEAFKQFMGFLLMGTVIFLIYVFGALVGDVAIPALLLMLLAWAVMAWIYGRWGARFLVIFLFLLLSFFSITSISDLIVASAQVKKLSDAKASSEDGWQPWTQDAVDAALTKGQPVFVDFTAAWCLSCKVNERVALGTDAVKQAFADKKVALFVADWTHSDPEISKTLQKFGRDGVPLYLVYSPKNPGTPQVLPEVLTPGIVLDALGKL